MMSVLIVGHVWPEPKSTAAGVRMLQLIKTFKDLGYTVTFACSSVRSEHSIDLVYLGVQEVEIELNDSSFDHFIKELSPVIVVFDRFMTEEQFGWRVAEQCPEAVRILDTEDLHCLRKGRADALKDNRQFDRSYLYNDIARREIASIFRSDLSLIISEEEMNILKKDFKIDAELLHYLPFLLDTVTEEKQKALPSFDHRHDFITIGNFMHEPNFDAIIYLKREIWPLIRKALPEVRLHIYGSYVPNKAMQILDKEKGFLIKGYTEDVHQVMMHARVCLAPLRFGAGLKGKLIDAMMNGTPCVTTHIGAEGLFGNMEPNGFIEDDVNCFADKAVQLYRNRDLWETKQADGYKVVNERFNGLSFLSPFAKTLEILMANLGDHRQNNFTGSMLNHHQLQSTKYMSRWIEEKNKKRIHEI